MKLLLTDIDNTMVWLNKTSDSVKVEEVYNKEGLISFQSYISNKSEQLLTSLMNNPNKQIVPITMRTISELKRVNYFGNTEWAICAGGGNIIHNGSLYAPYTQYIVKIKKNYTRDYDYLSEQLKGLMPLLKKPAKLADNCYFILKTRHADEMPNVVELVKDLIKNKPWVIDVHSNVLYLRPDFLTKAFAVSYFLENVMYNADHIVTAGDSDLDLEFINLGDHKFVLKDSEYIDVNQSFFKDNDYIITNEGGFKGTEEILNYFNDI